MPKFETTRKVHHSARQMYDLVADIESYPQFVPLCQSLKIRGREVQKDGSEILIADMTIAYGPIRESFVTRVVLDKNNHKISASYIDGPFKYLDNIWRFEDAETGAAPSSSNVLFSIDYEFKSRTLGAVMGSMFDRAFRKFSSAFETRADVLYD
ncbi:MAG: ubiquinone-binding protein [Hyphomicrobiales bacterium]|nr:MAG: ubiquinone-binding protein [Hyphomicrobiales bacterium]